MMVKNKIIYLLLIILSLSFIGISQSFADTKGTLVLNGYVEEIPTSFYGTWRVVASLIDTDAPLTFKEKSLDLWNLTRTNDVITLSNPFNGAKADIVIDSVNNSEIVFRKSGNYDDKLLTDTVKIKLSGDSFTGVDYLRLDTYSGVNGKIIKTETAKYSLKGEKIAGQSVIEN